jgi:hypothetical protein
MWILDTDMDKKGKTSRQAAEGYGTQTIYNVHPADRPKIKGYGIVRAHTSLGILGLQSSSKNRSLPGSLNS